MGAMEFFTALFVFGVAAGRLLSLRLTDVAPDDPAIGRHLLAGNIAPLRPLRRERRLTVSLYAILIVVALLTLLRGG